PRHGQAAGPDDSPGPARPAAPPPRALRHRPSSHPRSRRPLLTPLALLLTSYRPPRRFPKPRHRGAAGPVATTSPSGNRRTTGTGLPRRTPPRTPAPARPPPATPPRPPTAAASPAATSPQTADTKAPPSR